LDGISRNKKVAMIFNEEHVQGNQMFEIGLNSVLLKIGTEYFSQFLKGFNVGAFKQFKNQIKERNKFYQMVPHLFIGRKVAIPSYSKMERFKNSIFTHLYSIFSGEDGIFKPFSFLYSHLVDF
jgi:hypothetical protein